MSLSEESKAQSNDPAEHDERRAAQSQDEADNPKDELQDDVDEASTKPASPAPANDGGNGTCHLLRMPPEIRLMIFEMVLGYRHIWPSRNMKYDGRVHYWSCERQADIRKNSKSWCEEVTWPYDAHWRRHQLHLERQNEYASRLDLGLSRTCKGIYTDTRKLVFTKNNFVFTQAKDLRNLCGKLSIEQRSWIREVTIVYKIKVTRCKLSNRHTLWHQLNLWEPELTNHIFPLANLLKLHFVAYIGARRLAWWSEPRPPMVKLGLSKVDVPINKAMFQNLDYSYKEPEYSVFLDCESSLIPWFRLRYWRYNEDQIRRRLGVTEEDNRKFVDRLKEKLLSQSWNPENGTEDKGDGNPKIPIKDR